ncbi:hypothetical protein N1851_014004 [Merluccius polli]|uniref:THAP-type domain-containing protein n=1 Tax=Merluccius polli TaxID=89951 RepID=A0AA47MUZ7_MERPO|nr:hypothetical protein N1851_014004 [Merluccius polli]
MPGNNCCVENCSNASHDRRGNHKNSGLQFFRFPKWRKHLGEQVSDITNRRRISWVAAIRRKDLTFDHIPQSMRVCSLHFHSGKPSYEMLENHPEWTPSLRLGHSEVKTTDGARYQRQVKHQEQVPPLAGHQEQQPPSPAQDQWPPSPAQEQRPPSPAQDQECGLCTSRRDVINSLLEENRKLKEEAQDQRPPSLAQDLECGLCKTQTRPSSTGPSFPITMDPRSYDPSYESSFERSLT